MYYSFKCLFDEIYSINDVSDFLFEFLKLKEVRDGFDSKKKCTEMKFWAAGPLKSWINMF